MSSELMAPNASFIRIENEKRVHHWLLRRRRIPRVFRFVGLMQRLFPMNCKKKQARQSLFFSFADPIVHLGQSFGLRVWPIYSEFPLRGSISSPRNFFTFAYRLWLMVVFGFVSDEFTDNFRYVVRSLQERSLLALVTVRD